MPHLPKESDILNEHLNITATVALLVRRGRETLIFTVTDNSSETKGKVATLEFYPSYWTRGSRLNTVGEQARQRLKQL